MHKKEATKVGEKVKEIKIRQLEISNVLYETKTEDKKIQILNGRIKAWIKTTRYHKETDSQQGREDDRVRTEGVVSE